MGLPLIKMLIEKLSNTAHISNLHGTNARNGWCSRQLLKFKIACHWCTRREGTKPNFNELLWV